LLQRATAIRNTIAGHAAVVRQRESILGAAADRDDAQLRLSKAEALIEPLQRAIDELDAKRLRAATVGSTLSSLQSEGTTKADLIKTLTEQSAVIGSVPCAGMDIHMTCPLLAQARARHNRLTSTPSRWMTFGPGTAAIRRNWINWRRLSRRCL
jgi:exonuclease SbcC